MKEFSKDDMKGNSEYHKEVQVFFKGYNLMCEEGLTLEECRTEREKCLNYDQSLKEEIKLYFIALDNYLQGY